MGTMRTRGFVLLVLLSPALGQSQGLRTKDYVARMQIGLDDLYRLDYEDARRQYQHLAEIYPEHPGPPLSLSVAIWLEELFERRELDIDRFISPGYFTQPADRDMDPGDREAFFNGVERSQMLAESWIERHSGDSDARYYLGACEAALGVFAFTIDRSYRSALRHGKKAYEIQRALIEDDPRFYDSYLTLGTYEYIVGNLPWYIKWLALIAGYHGNERRGFEYLIQAANDGFLVRNDARVLLMVLYVRERRYDYALQMARQLHERYPENFLFHLNRAQILERLDRPGEAVETFLEIISRAESRTPNYQKLDLGRLRYPVGERLFEVGRREAALRQFEAALSASGVPESDRVHAGLRAGEILEALGRREEALELYQRVQRLEDIGGSHRAAGRRMQALRPEVER
jgi:tetratricopeptide (TPR) repeat protein